MEGCRSSFRSENWSSKLKEILMSKNLTIPDIFQAHWLSLSSLPILGINWFELCKEIFVIVRIFLDLHGNSPWWHSSIVFSSSGNHALIHCDLYQGLFISHWSVFIIILAWFFMAFAIAFFNFHLAFHSSWRTILKSLREDLLTGDNRWLSAHRCWKWVKHSWPDPLWSPCPWSLW